MPLTTSEPLTFATAANLRAWLATHHASASELWVRIWKKASGQPSVTWEDCVIEAIAYGWIDGHKKPFDDKSFLQRMSPRKANSNWSMKNRTHAERLIKEGRMSPAGLALVEAARKDGRWESVYAGSAEMAIPRDFLDALEARPAAKAFFKTLDRKNLYPIYYRLQTAKRPETRTKRMMAILAQLDRNERFH
jgi:uncharacterized protein YdeI (YjbR/CyaY-like superfamily)